MITSLRLVNFKNFADETLRVGPFTVIVGANASGKSNIRDAFRFLHGIGRGYTLAEIIGGQYGGGGQSEWAEIRGAMKEIIRFGQPAFSLQVKMENLAYTIEVGRNEARNGAFQVTRETLEAGSRTIYTSHPGEGDPVYAQGDDTRLVLHMEKISLQRAYDRQFVQGNYARRIMVRPDQPALTQIREHRRVLRAHKEYAEQAIKVLANMRFLDLDLNRMRRASFSGQIALGDGGENLPTVLQAICADPQREKILTEWLRELTPMDVRGFEFPTDSLSGRVQLVLREANDRQVSAYAASDGTLRFLAMLAALLGPNPHRLYMFEEIDNGIHPARVQLLIDLIEGQTAKGASQVVTTTHSPDLLTIINDDTFENTSVVGRLDDADEAIIRPVAELPKAGALRKSQGLGRLLAGGWMEDALAFTEGDNDEEGK